MISKKWSRIDGRYFLGGSHVTLAIISVLFFNLQRTWFQMGSACVCALVVEWICRKLSSKNQHRTIFDSFFSAATEAAGLLILVRSPSPWIYMFMAALAVSSKYLFRVDERRHLFNPTNIAIVVCLTMMPRSFFEVRPDEFDVSLYSVIHVFCFGVCAVYLGKTWRITAGYFVGIVACSALLAVVKHENFIYFIGPEMGAIGMIFMFLMITDPKTTPTIPWRQYLFGGSVAIFLYVLRVNEMIYANYFALFLVCLLRGFGLLIAGVIPLPDLRGILRRNKVERTF